MFPLTLSMIVLSLFAQGYSLIGYECGKQGINKTTISLVQVPECLIESRNISIKPVKVLITQPSSIKIIKVNQCQIDIIQLIYRCGKTIDQMYEGGLYPEFAAVSRDECETMILKKVFVYEGRTIKFTGDVVPLSLITWGSIGPHGSCSPGGILHIDGKTFDRPVRSSAFKIRSRVLSITLNVEADKLILPNGSTCSYKSEHCFDPDFGNLYWTREIPKCYDDQNQVSLVYSGSADLVTDHDKPGSPSFIQVAYNDYDFQILLLDRRLIICGMNSYYTEHNKLFVTIQDPSNMAYIPPLSNLESTEVNLMTYFNSKIIYVMRNTKEEVERLFHLFSHERCKSENRITQNLLTLAIINPVEFAYEYTGRPGHTAIQRGETIHVFKCTAVPITLRSTTDCYNELPVNRSGNAMFLNPRSRILTTVGTVVDCNPELSSSFFIDEEWIRQTAIGFDKGHQPLIISPDRLSFTYKEVKNLDNGGIYTEKAMDSLQRSIVSPLEQKSVEVGVIKALNGQQVMPNGYTLSNGFGRLDYENLESTYNTWKERERSVERFGSLVGVFIFILLILNVILKTFSGCLNFSVLNQEFGCLTALLCFWWNDFSHHLINRHVNPPWRTQKKSPTVSQDDSDRNVELGIEPEHNGRISHISVQPSLVEYQNEVRELMNGKRQ